MIKYLVDPWIPSVLSPLISLRFILLFSIIVSLLSCSIFGWKNKQTIVFIYYLIIEVFTSVSIIPSRSTSDSPRYYYLWKICTWVCIILIATLHMVSTKHYVTLIEAKTNGWLRTPVWGFQWIRVEGFLGLGILGWHWHAWVLEILVGWFWPFKKMFPHEAISLCHVFIFF